MSCHAHAPYSDSESEHLLDSHDDHVIHVEDKKRGYLPVATNACTCQRRKKLRVFKKITSLIGLFLLSWAFYKSFQAIDKLWEGNYNKGLTMSPLPENVFEAAPSERCKRNLVDYTGESKFETESDEIYLSLGGQEGDQLSTHVTVKGDDIPYPIIKIEGQVSPSDDEEENQYVNIKVTDKKGRWNGKVTYTNHKVRDEDSGYLGTASAFLNVEIILPNYQRFGILELKGNVASVEGYSLYHVQFSRFIVQSKLGNVVILGEIKADTLITNLHQGNLFISKAKTGTRGGALELIANVNTGYAIVAAETNLIDNNSTFHRVLVKSETGDIDVRVRPSNDEVLYHMGPATTSNLDLTARTVFGIVEARVQLFDNSQIVALKVSGARETKASVSDLFSGRFNVESGQAKAKAKANVKALEGSTSVIEYEEKSDTVKKGTKTTSDGEDILKGHIDVVSEQGSVTLTFF